MIVDVPATLGQALTSMRRQLAAAGIASPALDARLLVMAATGLSHEALIAAPGRTLAEAEARRADELLRRRLAREPLSRIFAEREFYGRTFAIGPACLDPRPDTEVLVERSLGFARTRAAAVEILDLGTGSGAILVTLLAELPQARGTGTDISRAALATARDNALRHGVADRARFVCAHWCRGLQGRYDLIVANPPYIATGALDSLQPEVRIHDPRQALDGGDDGLDAYRSIAAEAGALLAPDGLLAVEIGAGQNSAVAALFAGYGWDAAASGAEGRDLAGHVRVLAFSRRGRLTIQQKRVGIREANR